MARVRKTAQEFIQESFSPIIAVLNGPRVEQIVSKNNLSLPELLQPFAVFDSEGQFREPNGTVCVIKNFKFILRDVNWKPLQPIDARRLLNSAVSSNYSDNTVTLQVGNKKLNLPQCTIWFDSWRETYFDVQFPSDHEFSKHFIACMLIGTTLDENIVESFNNLNQQFSQFLTVTPPKLPKWFNSNVLKSYVLLNDVSTVPKEKADAMFETMKQNFDATHCYMLSINSRSAMEPALSIDPWKQFIKRCDDSTEGKPVASNISATPYEPPPALASHGVELDSSQLTISTHTDISHPLLHCDNEFYDNANSLQTHSYAGSSESVNVQARGLDQSTEVHGAALNTTDINAIKKFMQDYIAKGLLPYFERQASLLSEAASNRKGVSRSLLSATKRWFGTSKGSSNTGNNSVIPVEQNYSNECPELQLRRLGDLWMMCGQWQRAFETYHTAKREFYADGAWLCYAGALEMAALCAFMAGDSNRKTHGYMDESIVTYLNTCRMVQFAVRATLLSALCLSSTGQHGEAAKQLIRMTSEDSDLRSAMLLEQAALCFVQGCNIRPMCRKYAFHMVLAGHRFSKAGQKKHAFRCYKQAYEVYSSSGWRLATEHAQLALGRLAGALKRCGEAARWLALPLAPGSPQPQDYHRAALRDYLMAHQNWIANADLNDLPSLPVPLLDQNKTALVTAGPAPIASPGRVPATSVSLYDDPMEVNNRQWHKMEEMLLQAAQGAVPMIFKPTINLYTSKLDESPTVPQGEPVQISITIKNPIKVQLLLSDLELIWKFQPAPDETGKPGLWLGNEPYISKGIQIENNIIVSQKIKTVVLEGEQEQALSFSFTPMQVGQVIVLGVAFKLTSRGEDSDSKDLTISGKLPFGTEGSVVDHLKGIQKRLQITVGPCAPCLQMTFTEMSPTAISEEMRSIEVEFRNVGPVDMSNLHIVVSHPDCLQFVKPEDPKNIFRELYDEKYNDASSQGGSEGGAWRFGACRSAAARQVCALGAVPRGAACRGVVLLRARHHHHQHHHQHHALRLMAYYESAAPHHAHTSYRLLRHVFHLQLYEAVDVIAIPHRNVAVTQKSASEKLCLTAEIKNVSDEKYPVSIELLEISLLSRQWQLTNLVAARDKSESLAPREKMHIVVESVRLYNPPELVHASRLQISSNTPESQHTIRDPPYCKFVVEYKNYFIEDDDYGLPQKKKKGLIESMLITRWKCKDTSGRTVVGQTCAWIDCFAKPSQEKDSINLEIPLGDFDSQTDIICKKKLENVVIFKLEHTSNISHNFKEKRICKIPVTINIVNCYDVPVEVFIDMSKRKEIGSQVGWAGALSSGGGSETGISVSLAELESRRISVSAACTAPGTYLLGSAFTLTSRAADSSVTNSHLCNNTSLLVVTVADA